MFRSSQSPDYRAESEDAVREHADRAGLPATRIDRRGQPLEGEYYSGPETINCLSISSLLRDGLILYLQQL